MIHYEIVIQADSEGEFPDPQDLFERLDVIIRADADAEEVEDPHQEVNSTFKMDYTLEHVAPAELLMIDP